jgi:type II secretory pathway pseudopilin PulG
VRPGGRRGGPAGHGQQGFVLPGTIALMAVLLVLSAVAITLALDSLDTSNRDRRVVRSLQAADAGVDIAIFRLNHMLVAGASSAVLGSIPNAVQSLGCTSVNVSGVYTISQVSPSAPQAYCAAESGTAGDVEGASYTYQSSTALNVTTSLGDLLVRSIVATGSVGGVQRRVLVKVRAVIGGAGSLVLYQRIRHTECTAKPTTAAVDSGCPGADVTS